MIRRLSIAFAFLAVVVMAGVSHAQQDEVSEPGAVAAQGPAVEDGVAEATAVEAGAEAEAVHSTPVSQSVTVGDVLFVASGTEGIQVVDVANPEMPELIDVLVPGEDVSGLHLVGTALVVVLGDYSIATFDVEDPRIPMMMVGGHDAVDVDEQPIDHPDDDAPPIEGTVVEVASGWVTLDVGQTSGVYPGMRFAILSKYKSSKAVVTIQSVGAQTALGKIPMRASASPGDSVVSTCEQWKLKQWILGASEGESYTQIGLHFKPIIGVGRGADSWGFIGNVEISHKFKQHAKISFLLAPAALGHSSSGKGAVFEFGGLGGLSTRFFEILLGVGGHMSVGLSDNHPIIFNKLRLGSINGFHMQALLSWIIPSPRKLLPTTATFSVDVPVTSRTNIYLELGGGNLAHYFDADGSGWANAMLGVRLFALGTGGPGTVIVSAAFGHGYAWDQRCEDDAGNDIPCVGGSTWGPLVSLGLDWRF